MTIKDKRPKGVINPTIISMESKKNKDPHQNKVDITYQFCLNCTKKECKYGTCKAQREEEKRLRKLLYED